MGLKELVKKYSKAGPRYTSYPTAPQWKESIDSLFYESHLIKNRASDRSLAIYVHIPFCESLCYYCACNVKITKNHSVESAYVDAVLKEMQSVSQALGSEKQVVQIAWGGGTPTFLSTENIERLAETTKKIFKVTSDAEISIELDPRVTTGEQLTLLRGLGFNRVSLGVQDFNAETQKAIHRIQSAEMTEAMLRRCRELGFSGINFDLIYGLPYQTLESFEKTLIEVGRIRPDRIALYNYAHLPNLVPHQKILDRFPMPGAEERIEIFTLAVNELRKMGYRTIGMDHFALESDELYHALTRGSLYRNFMGYTVKKGTDMVGFGTSAIGEYADAFFQNFKEVELYQSNIRDKGLSVWRGIELSDDDKQRKWVIQSIMCQFRLSFEDFHKQFGKDFSEVFSMEMSELEPFVNEGSLTIQAEGIEILEQGRLFLRNIAMVFDAYLRGANAFKSYSRTV